MKSNKIKICNSCHRVLGEDDFYYHKNLSCKLGGYRCSYCKKCGINQAKLRQEGNEEHRKIYNKQWREFNPEYDKQYYQNNKEHYRERDIQYYQDNKEYRKEYVRQWKKNNKEHYKEYAKEYGKQYYQKNRGKVNAWTAKRRAIKLDAMPLWANKEEIGKIYKEARKLTKTTGIKYEVDHIIPLQGKNVCGLHTEKNLQIITGTENRKKSNKYKGE